MYETFFFFILNRMYATLMEYYWPSLDSQCHDTKICFQLHAISLYNNLISYRLYQLRMLDISFIIDLDLRF